MELDVWICNYNSTQFLFRSYKYGISLNYFENQINKKKINDTKYLV